ncbi:MAG: 3',5'-cyclic-nucleotide phosphodiesterase [Piccolia ochrophora]|nr:MAG: 3',5'-cyclic-nucleotide phosphodiesterase [Piccolia ochrophora]
MVMDHAACNVIYVDKRAHRDRTIHRDVVAPRSTTSSTESSPLEVFGEDEEVSINVHNLLATFERVYLCASAETCRSKSVELNEIINSELVPTLVLVHVNPNNEAPDTAPGAPARPNSLVAEVSEGFFDPQDPSLCGARLLQFIAAEVRHQHLSKLFVPVALLSAHQNNLGLQSEGGGRSLSATLRMDSDANASSYSANQQCPDTSQVLKYLENGAVDVMSSPLPRGCVSGLVAHAYRAHKEVAREQKAFLAVRRGRKRSWVGVDEEKPHAYLREAMVSGLMDGICQPQNVGESFDESRLQVQADRVDLIASAVGTWAFSAHEYSDDELLYAASTMLQHALTMQELEQWRIPTDHMKSFLLATRTAYNAFVPYHNFRHVVDVLQAIFYFLLQIGTLPAFGTASSYPPGPMSPVASLLRPFDALTLLISAIGHDVGHPGVNNAFLVTLNAPLAQLYNDRSVLESFHCAAFSQILRRYWPAAFQSADMRRLMINSILATDMGVHFDYMKRLGFLQERLHENDVIDGWDGRYTEEQRTLTCSLLIKCADISNVARKYEVAAQWAAILTDEFARQASMENDLGIPSALFAPPVKDSIVEMAKSQIGFMNLFALPLFQAVTDVIPAMEFSIKEMNRNKAVWEKKIQHANEKDRTRDARADGPVDGFQSPRSGSMSSLTQSPEQHPPDPIASPSELSQQSSAHLSSQDSLNTHRPSLPPALDPAALEHAPLPALRRLHPAPDDAPQRSLPASLGPTSPVSPETSPRTAPPRLHARRSSNHVPRQLQLGVGTPEGRRGSADHALVAVLVTSPGKCPKGHDSHAGKRDKRKSSEKSSLPSDWHSQATSPTNVTYSPTTGGTSFLSDNGSDPDRHNGDKRAPYTASILADTVDRSEMKPGGVMNTMKEIRHRPSRWKLNFWKSKKKARSTSPP